ncbi:unnamed protein product, partial [Rotaria sp. Silwood1]
VEVNYVAPSFETVGDHITDHMQTSYVNVDETDVKVCIYFLFSFS